MMNFPPTASERLTQSRERMRLVLQELGSPADQNGSARVDDFFANWLESLKTTPGTNLLLSLVQDWWFRQPLRVSLVLACGAAQVVLQPIAQRHPLGLVVGAAAAGALMVLTKPWRWIPKSAWWSGLLPKLIAQLQPQATSATSASGIARMR